MIENVNASKEAANGEFLDIRKYVGVASVNVLAVNPDNAKLRKFGWNILEDATEPNYILTKTLPDGRETQSTRIRLLVQIQDLEEKPVISLDFWCQKGVQTNVAGDKCKVIDCYGRTAWVTKEEFKAGKVPIYKNGQPANISTPYKACHIGEEELVSFLFKYLNITPLQIFDKTKNGWTPSKNPGRLTVDNWGKICDGDVSEIAEYLALQPDNRVKVVLGIMTTDDNKTYQSFLNSGYIGNGMPVDRNTGEYTRARTLIDKFVASVADRRAAGKTVRGEYTYSSLPVREYKETATDVAQPKTMFDDEGNYIEDDDDLPFAQ